MLSCIVFETTVSVASYHDGFLQVMQDRKLMQDDNRGLGQGVEDNRVTRTRFRLLLESVQPGCAVSKLLIFLFYLTKKLIILCAWCKGSKVIFIVFEVVNLIQLINALLFF